MQVLSLRYAKACVEGSLWRPAGCCSNARGLNNYEMLAVKRLGHSDVKVCMGDLALFRRLKADLRFDRGCPLGSCRSGLHVKHPSCQQKQNATMPQLSYIFYSTCPQGNIHQHSHVLANFPLTKMLAAIGARVYVQQGNANKVLHIGNMHSTVRHVYPCG